MIGPVSGTGRAMMASLQQAIQKGMPPDQAIQYVKSMATQGVAPLADLYAMMNQFQRLKQRQVKPPQNPPTVKDQLDALDQRMGGGIASLPAPVMDNAQFAGGGIVAFSGGGLTDEEEAEFEKLQSLMAEGLPHRGGMSPFGGSAPSIIASSPAVGGLQALYEKRYKELRAKKEAAEQAEIQAERQAAIATEAQTRGLAIPTAPAKPAPPPPPAEEQPAPPPQRRLTAPAVPDARAAAAPAAEAAPATDRTPEGMLKAAEPGMEALEKWRQSRGIGRAREQLSQFLSEENNRLTEQFGRDKMLAFAEAGFKMAAAASRPGATFLGALSEGAISGTQALRGLQKEMDATRREMKMAMLKLDEAKELEQEGDLKLSLQLGQQGRQELDVLRQRENALKVDYARIAQGYAQIDAQREATQATREATAFAQQETMSFRRQQEMNDILQNDPNYYRLQAKLGSLNPDEDQEEIARIKQKLENIESDARRKAGIPTRYVYDKNKGMIPVEP